MGKGELKVLSLGFELVEFIEHRLRHIRMGVCPFLQSS
jgi:hypothetical protein